MQLKYAYKFTALIVLEIEDFPYCDALNISLLSKRLSLISANNSESCYNYQEEISDNELKEPKNFYKSSYDVGGGFYMLF